MRSLRLNFADGGVTFDYSERVQDFDATVQNALVNVGTDLGSDPYYPNRGTSLLKDGVEGKMVDSVAAMHSANFAALKTTTFLQQTNLEDPNGMQNFQLQLSGFAPQKVALTVRATSLQNEVRGNTVILD